MTLHIFSQVAKKTFWSRSRKWDTTVARFHLAKCLVSDDCAIERIAPSRQVQVLIGTCIESFSEKHCKKDIIVGSVNRKIHVAEHPSEWSKLSLPAHGSLHRHHNDETWFQSPLRSIDPRFTAVKMLFPLR
jgi:hypothetical protein